MVRLLALIPAVMLAAALGCGGEKVIPPEQAYDPQESSGQVDASLPAEAQARQQVLRGVLVSLQQGVDLEMLPDYHPGVRFAESEEDFLEGTINLSGWDFDGPVQGDDVPVVLFLSQDTTGHNERRVRRVYTVGGAGRRWTISRNK